MQSQQVSRLSLGSADLLGSSQKFNEISFGINDPPKSGSRKHLLGFAGVSGIDISYIIKGSLDEKLPSYEVLKMRKE